MLSTLSLTLRLSEEVSQVALAAKYFLKGQIWLSLRIEYQRAD